MKKIALILILIIFTSCSDKNIDSNHIKDLLSELNIEPNVIIEDNTVSIITNKPRYIMELSHQKILADYIVGLSLSDKSKVTVKICINNKEERNCERFTYNKNDIANAKRIYKNNTNLKGYRYILTKSNIVTFDLMNILIEEMNNFSEDATEKLGVYDGDFQEVLALFFEENNEINIKDDKRDVKASMTLLHVYFGNKNTDGKEYKKIVSLIKGLWYEVRGEDIEKYSKIME